MKKRLSRISPRFRLILSAVALTAILAGLTLDVPQQAIATTEPEADTTLDRASDLDLDSLYAAKSEEIAEIEEVSVDLLDPSRTIKGHVSWYGPGFHGRKTANGERFNQNAMTAAHKKLAFNTIVRVEDRATGRAILVRINDRGPYIRGRVIDLSKEAAGRLGMRGRGTCAGDLAIFPMREKAVEVFASRTASDDAPSDTAIGRNYAVSFLTFDSDVRGAMPDGFGVVVSTANDFESAINTFDRLRDRFETTWLTRVSIDGETSWVLSVGLASHRHLSEDLRLELLPEFPSAEIVRFEEGLPRDYVAKDLKV